MNGYPGRHGKIRRATFRGSGTVGQGLYGFFFWFRVVFFLGLCRFRGSANVFPRGEQTDGTGALDIAASGVHHNPRGALSSPRFFDCAEAEVLHA